MGFGLIFLGRKFKLLGKKLFSFLLLCLGLRVELGFYLGCIVYYIDVVE